MPIPLMAIYGGIQAGLGLYNAIKGGRDRERAMGPLREAQELAMQTARGGGPIVEQIAGGYTRAGELAGQRAARSVGAGGLSTALAQTLKTQGTIGGMRAAAAGVATARAGAMQTAVGAGGALSEMQMGVAEGRLGAASEGIGMGLSTVMRYLSRLQKTGGAQGALSYGPQPGYGSMQGTLPNYGSYLFGGGR